MTSNTMDAFKNILSPLTNNNWNFINTTNNGIIMNKKYEELSEINIQFDKSNIHLVLPLNNSNYSFYKKFNNIQDSQNYLQQYIQDLY
jgi:hypothetical protein